VQCADIPGVRDGDGLCCGGNRSNPSVCLTCTAWIGAELPVAVEINPSRSEGSDLQQAQCDQGGTGCEGAEQVAEVSQSRSNDLVL
jgi:hypothetical protein